MLSIGGERLICMRNPSGTPPASDTWGAGSREWLRTPHGSEGGPADGGTMLDELSRSNTPFAAAAVRTDPRGVTWMSIADFVTM